jgi:hypothetical protein
MSSVRKLVARLHFVPVSTNRTNLVESVTLMLNELRNVLKHLRDVDDGPAGERACGEFAKLLRRPTHNECTYSITYLV